MHQIPEEHLAQTRKELVDHINKAYETDNYSNRVCGKKKVINSSNNSWAPGIQTDI